MILSLLAKFLELSLILRLDPARSIDIYGFVNRLDFVLICQSIRHHIKLELANRADNQVTVNKR